MATQAFINPELLSWARNRSGYSEAVLAKKINVNVDKVTSWEEGELKPTFRQAQRFAQVTNTPFGFLFLPKPPKESFPIPDLRTIDSQDRATVSTELRDIVTQVTQKQNWYKEYLISHNHEELNFIGLFTVNSPINTVVNNIRSTIGVNSPTRGSWDEYQRKIIKGAEEAGILVMRSGIVGNNTRRKLLVQEFRGFAISDKLAPVVFINSSDAPTARLFTLIHELAHLWLGSSGVSDNTVSHAKEEQFCNAVAGEFLVPEELLLKLWDHEQDFLSNLYKIAPILHVSKLVVARRALTLGIVSNNIYSEFYQKELADFKNKDASGGSFYVTAKAKNSAKLSNAIITEALSGRMLLRDAGKLLGVAPNSIRTFARSLAI